MTGSDTIGRAMRWKDLIGQARRTSEGRTWAVDEGPVVLGLAGTHAGVERHLQAGRHAGQAGGGGHLCLEGPPVGALHALALARVAGVGAPAAARLIHALGAGPVPRAVLRWGGVEGQSGTLGGGCSLGRGFLVGETENLWGTLR